MAKLILLAFVATLAALASAAEENQCDARGLHQCNLTPEEIEGPYFILNDIPLRRDIKEDRQGIPMGIDLVFQNANNCAPIKGLIVHVWQTDAMGVYSGFRDFHGDLNVDRNIPTDNDRFLRGYQVTDAEGQVHFDSIVPGWYPHRCVHVHIETFLPPELGGNNQTIHTTQGYFPNDFIKSFLTKPVYKENPIKLIPNERDNVFVHEEGEKLIWKIEPVSNNPDKDGYNVKMTLGINLSN